MEAIIFGVLFVTLIPIVLFAILKPAIEDIKIRKNITNSDSFKRHYCFELDCTQHEATKQLSLRNVNDVIDYSFDANSLTINFKHLGASIEHQLIFYVVGNKTYLKVSRVNFFHERSNIPFMVNRFFVEKIAAKPMNYSDFETTISTLTIDNASPIP